MISIVIPIYNAEKTIGYTIESILNQKNADYEIIIVDDGSSDNSGEICRSYSLNDERVRYVHTENRGVSEARNEGIKLAKGEWITFVDSDDQLLPNAYNSVKENLLEDVELIVFGYKKRTNNAIVAPSENKKYYYNLQMIANDAGYLFTHGFFHPVWNKIYKKECIVHTFDCKRSLGEDILFNLDYLKHISKVVCLPSALYYYNDYSSADSLSHKYRSDAVEIQRDIREKFIELVGLDASRTEINNSYVKNILNSMQIVVYQRSLSEIEKKRIIDVWGNQVRDDFVKMNEHELDLDYFQRKSFKAIKKNRAANVYYVYKKKQLARALLLGRK